MINRNNYEEYFLLLADNELSPEAAAAVKQFAAQHPDLSEELDILLSCRLDAEPMPPFPKEKLLRPALWNTENIEPVHTQMLLMLDGELSAAEQQQLQQQIIESTFLQSDWNSLQPTRLAAETIVYPDKEALRRNDRKVRPLLWMRWAAAAAIVAGLGWMFWLQPPQRILSSTTVAHLSTPRQAVIQNTTQPQNRTVVQQAVSDNSQLEPHQQMAANTPDIPISNTNQQTIHQPEEIPTQPAVNEKIPTTSTLGSENKIVETDPVMAQLSSADISPAPNRSEADRTMQVAHFSTKTVALPMLLANQKTDVFTGSKNELTDEEEDYVRVGGARINKHKMRGLFRNVTRTVTRSFSKSKIEPDVYATR